MISSFSSSDTPELVLPTSTIYSHNCSAFTPMSSAKVANWSLVKVGSFCAATLFAAKKNIMKGIR